MTQYHHERPPGTAVESTTAKPRTITSDADIANLRNQLRQQQDDIAELQREFKRLKNELRVAVNAFNLKSHG
jgi:septal ring factor EnvC (AmiA/AmiB activator)